jgi:N-acetylglucosaminyldiphosphoundecaprenol N-acetyl-beta-D-mannosaminyltransferase
MKSEIITRERLLLGLRIHSFNLQELIELLASSSQLNDALIVYGFSANIYSRIRKTPEFVLFFKKIDIVIPDGQGIPVLARLFKVDIKERVGIVNLSNRLLQLANEKTYKLYLLGATEDINRMACKKIRNDFPQIAECKGRNGYFSSEEEHEIVKEINDYNPDILFIGISSPKKEIFALKYKILLNTRLIIPCGGWIDVMGGKVKRPLFTFNNIPIAWLFRFLQEPKRMFGPIIISLMDTIFCILPILYLKHLFGIEKNPSIVKHFGLEKKLMFIMESNKEIFT